MADGFFQHDPRVVAGQPGGMQVGGDILEQVWRGGQVVDAHPLGGGAQVAGQAAEVGALAGVHGEVIEAVGKALPGLRVEVGTGHLGAAMPFGQGLKGGAAVGAAGQGDNAHVAVQAAGAVQVVERWQQLVQGQVAGAAEHQHVAGDAQGGNSDSV